MKYNIFDDYNKAIKVIDSMNEKSISSTLRYIHLFTKKWRNIDYDNAHYLRRLLDIEFDTKIEEI